MVPGGMQAVQITVEHQRHPGQRVPVLHVALGKGPADPVPREPVGDLRVAEDIVAVVEIDEQEPGGLENVRATANASRPQTARQRRRWVVQKPSADCADRSRMPTAEAFGRQPASWVARRRRFCFRAMGQRGLRRNLRQRLSTLTVSTWSFGYQILPCFKCINPNTLW